MKTLFSIILLLSSLTVLAQTTTKTLTFDNEINLKFSDSPVTITSDQLVSPYTFNNIVFEDLSHLLLGNSTAPSEGIEATFDGDKSNIKLSGIITKNNWGIFTIQGDLSASDQGIYFIDEKNGSKNAKFALNWYVPFAGKRSYSHPLTSEKSQRAYYTIEKAKQEKIAELVKNYYYTRFLLEQSNIPVAGLDTSEFEEDLQNFNYKLDLSQVSSSPTASASTFITENKLETTKDQTAYQIEIINANDSIKVPVNKIGTPLKPKYDIDKVIKLYDVTISSMDSISSNMMKLENKLSQPYWTSKQFWYFGGSPFYEREEIKNVYMPNDMASFDDNFDSQLGDLFGIDFQIGGFYQSDKAFTKLFFGRVTLNASRGSNRSEFKKETFSSTPSSIGTGSIVTPNTLEGNLNAKDNDYSFGEKYGISAETYWFPFNRYGIFGQVGYNSINFRPGDGEDIDIWNLRLGVLINIKSKKKNFATLQLFADRSDLSLSPNGKDNNLRFGFKVGVPFNFKEKL